MIAAALKYWHWLAIGALVLLAQHLYVQNLHLQLDAADAGRVTADERTARESAARLHETKLAAREQTHATEQQEKDNAFTTEKSTLQARVAAEQQRAGSLREQLAVATTRGGAGGETDPAACQRAFARLETLGRLAGEGVELLVEGRGLLEQRDLDVQRLFNQVTVDRKACGDVP